MPDQAQARSMIVYGYCSSTSGAFSGILLTEYGEYLGCTSSPTEAGLPAKLQHVHATTGTSPYDSTFEYVSRSQIPTHAGLRRAIRFYMYDPPAPVAPPCTPESEAP